PIENKIPYVFSVPPKTIARFGLVDGHRVVFSVDKKHKPEENLSRCFVTEVLGHVNDVGVDILTLIRQAGVPYDFSEEVNEELLAIPTEVLAEEIPNRLDLRGERIFTIDGDDTKDIDDAISFAATEEGFTLGVHIADVTFYVREGSALDASALERGTSVYLADRVIPMLPHKLSSGICSLFPYVDRLTLSCIMTIDKSGNVTDYKIAQSIINSSERFTYTQVQELLDRGENEQLNQMDELRRILRNKRERRGALDFDIPESKIRIDDLGNVISIEPQPRNNATGIIEEFMILCNETIATHFLMRKLPFVYRTHDAPSVEKLLGLQKLIQNLGLNISAPDRANSSTLQKFLDAAKETSVAYAISSAVLHALPQACYTSDNPTHFGLASKAYCHFTSPIRRYADLQIHRIIKIAANEDFSTPPTEIIPAIENFRAILPAVCTQCSRTERTAEALERDVAELKKAQFMADKEGQSFEAIISGITAWGAFVLLNNTVEGLIPATNLQRHKFKHNKEKGVYEKTKREAGEKRPQILHHGTKVTVRLTQANTEERRLTFVLCKETKT
ncbi:MAG: VacB/RNase II family 3'-5' exoribonuclease, partial [Defluviitaleaceae bacterium]|nr:VacB/RNase II family 3'-5' exoribonuclease [Defluviitaleaceae bacterium]